jgi:hypothetical protein
MVTKLRTDRMISLAVAALALSVSCVGPSNPFDPDTPAEAQRPGAIFGRLELPGVDLSESAVQLVVLDGDGQRYEPAGDLGVVETRSGDEPLPAGLDDGDGVGGAFEVEVIPGNYSVTVVPADSGFPLFNPTQAGPVAVAPGERVFVPLRATPIAADSFTGVVEGDVAGATPGRPFLVQLLPIDVAGAIPRQQLLAADGRFTFDSVAPGVSYRVRVEGDGYAPVQTPDFVLAQGDSAAMMVMPGEPCGAPNAQCDVGTLRLSTLGQLFDIDYEELNAGARHASQRPYTRATTVPVALIARQLQLDDGSAPYDTIQMRALSEPAFAALTPADAQRWQDVTGFDDDFTVDVDLLEAHPTDAPDGVFAISAQLRVCATAACDTDVVESPVATLELVLDRGVPEPVDVQVDGASASDITATCEDFGSDCPPSNASPWTAVVEATLFDGAGRVTGWAVTLDDDMEPATYDVVDSAVGLAVLTGLAPGLDATDGTHTLRLWARDAAGNSGVVHERTLDVDVTPPALATTPLLVGGVMPPAGAALAVSSPQLELTLALDAAEDVVVRASLAADPSNAPARALASDALTFSFALPDADGDYTVRAFVEDVAGNRGPLLEVDLTLSRRGSVSGTVTLEGEASGDLDGVVVTACNDADLQAVTAADGSYTIADVPAGSCPLRAEHPGFLTQTLDVLVPIADVLNALPIDLLLTRGEVRGRVLLAGLQEHSGATIELLDSAQQAVATTATDAAGDWSLSVPVGNYDGVRASAARYASDSDLTTITVAEVGTATVPTLTLTMTSNDVDGLATLFGRTDHSSVEVTLTGALGSPNEGASVSATTDAAGAFSFTEVPLGDWVATYRYTGEAGWEAPVRAVTVAPGAPITLAAVQLRERFVVINLDEPVTNDASVELTLGASDCFEMRYGSLSDVSDGTWGSCAGTADFTLPGPDGINTVYAQFRDSQQTPSEIVSDDIVLDRTATITSFTEDSAGGTLARNDVLHLALDADGEAGGTATADLVGYEGDIALYDDGTRGDTTAGDGVYEVDYILRLGTDLVNATVTGRFTDGAGNPATPVDAAGSVTVAVPPVVVDLTVTPDTASGTAAVALTTDEQTTAVFDWGTDAFYGNQETSGGASTTHAFTLSGLVTAQQYHYRAVVTDLASNQTVTIDRTFFLQPDPPQRVIAIPGDGRFDVRWESPAQDNIVGYNVYRGDASGGPYTKLTTGGPSTSQGLVYGDTTVNNDTTYFYVVTSIDEFGNESDDSLEVTGTPAANSGPTTVSGAIGGQTVWSSAGSPYRIDANVAVAEGALLVIGPGTRVELTDDFFLRVDGELVSVGEAGSEVVFTSGRTTPATGDWSGVRFSDLSPAGDFDADAGRYRAGNLLYQTIIERSGAGGVYSQTSLAVVESTLQDNECRRYQGEPCSAGGVGQIGGELLVVDSLFRRNALTEGGDGAGGVGAQAGLTVHGGVIEDNECSPYENQQQMSQCAGGVFGYGARLLGVTIRNNVARNVNFGAGGAFFFGGGEILSSTISGNRQEDIENNSQGVSGGVQVMNGELRIVSSAITGNSVTAGEGAGGVSGSQMGSVYLIDSLVDSNTSSGPSSAGGVSIFMEGMLFAVQSTISGNTFSGGGSGAGGLYVSEGGLQALGLELVDNVSTTGGAHALLVTSLWEFDVQPPGGGPPTRVKYGTLEASAVSGGTADALPVVQGEAHMRWVTFRQNASTGTLLALKGGATLTECTLLDASPTVLVDNQNLFAVGTLDATGTHWGATTTAEMDAKGANDNITTITDFFDDIAIARVDYSDWAADALPHPAISAPLWGTVVAEGDAVSLEGAGDDPEDGALSGASLEWVSDLDGPLGTGSPLVTTTLTAGTHRISLVATDSGAKAAVAQVEVEVVP